jgi:hypothetical protein
MVKKQSQPKQSQEEIEEEVVNTMVRAKVIVDHIFGAHANVYGTHEVYDILTEYGVPEAEFASDLKRAREYAKTVYATEQPTPEMVFGIFERIINLEE